MIEYDVNKRWEQGRGHHPKTQKLMKRMREIDQQQVRVFPDFLDTADDGDAGETLMYYLDIVFDEEDEGC